MCGISVYIQKNDGGSLPMSSKIPYRGPDNRRCDKGNICNGYSYCMIFDRLSIVGVEKGFQPIRFRKNKLVCNGEIYNYMNLPHIKGRSDCYCIKQTFMDFINQRYSPIEAFKLTIKLLDGVFAIVMKYENYMFIARDPVGVRPLFYTSDMIRIPANGNIFEFCSEEKGIKSGGIQFPPGHLGWIDFLIEKPIITLESYNTPLSQLIPVMSYTGMIKTLLTTAVTKRLMSERPIMYFLSGGLDSSIIAAIGASISDGPISTCSIGIDGSPDLEAARKMAILIGSIHHEVRLDIDEAIALLPELIQHLETYDTTTIRASMPMYLLSKWVKENTDCRVIMSGEGADELFGGYLYFHYAPNSNAFQRETIRLIENLHQTDVLRSDRSTAAHGLEVRVPFLDREFVKYIVSIVPEEKMPNGGIEKRILRESFKDMLHPDIFNRQKEAFSDGVGTDWVSQLKEYAGQYVDEMNDGDRSMIKNKMHNPPLSNEEIMNRHMYHKLYNSEYNINEIWRPKWTNVTDPSATQLAIHE